MVILLAICACECEWLCSVVSKDSDAVRYLSAHTRRPIFSLLMLLMLLMLLLRLRMALMLMVQLEREASSLHPIAIPSAEPRRILFSSINQATNSIKVNSPTQPLSLHSV